MSLSRRGFFRGVFCAASALALSPIEMALGIPKRPWWMKDRSPELKFEPMEYGRSVFMRNDVFFGGTKMYIPLQYRDSETES